MVGRGRKRGQEGGWREREQREQERVRKTLRKEAVELEVIESRRRELCTQRFTETSMQEVSEGH